MDAKIRQTEMGPREADHALRLDKLINNHVPGLNPAVIPKPFNQIHSVELGDREAIIQAVKATPGAAAAETGENSGAARRQAQGQSRASPPN